MQNAPADLPKLDDKTKASLLRAGIYEQLRNADSEAFAHKVAAVIHDPAERQRLFLEFCTARPGLKRWEADAIVGRVMTIARNRYSAAGLLS